MVEGFQQLAWPSLEESIHLASAESVTNLYVYLKGEQYHGVQNTVVCERVKNVDITFFVSPEEHVYVKLKEVLAILAQHSPSLESLTLSVHSLVSAMSIQTIMNA